MTKTQRIFLGAGSSRLADSRWLTRAHDRQRLGRLWSYRWAMAIAVLVVTGLASPLHGQTGFPGDLSEQARVLVLSPTLRLTDLGWDNNIFRVNKTEAPTGDFTTTVTPALEASFRLRRLQISGRGDVDFVYFREMSQLRSIDTDDGVRVGLLLGRVRPYVGADWASARHRRNFEIDLPVRRVDSSWVAGVDFSLSGKTSVGVISRRSREDFKGEQKRASKSGQIYWARICKRSAGRSPVLGSWARMLIVPLGWRQWMTRVPALTPTRNRSWPTGTRASGPTLSIVRRLQM